MKPSLKKVKHLRDTLVGLEMQIGTINQDLSIVAYNLTHLRKLENDLIFNIIFLKKDKIIAIASEYKKSKEELKSVQKSIRKYVNDEIRLSRALEEYTRKFNTCVEEYEFARKQLDSEKVILIFDPSKRRKKNEGQEGGEGKN